MEWRHLYWKESHKHNDKLGSSIGVCSLQLWDISKNSGHKGRRFSETNDTGNWAARFLSLQCFSHAGLASFGIYSFSRNVTTFTTIVWDFRQSKKFAMIPEKWISPGYGCGFTFHQYTCTSAECTVVSQTWNRRHSFFTRDGKHVVLNITAN